MIYFDHAATTPCSDDVIKAMEPYFSKKFGNPSSIYEAGREAKAAVEEAREQIASYINCKPSEIIFTSGGTESDNLAIKGVMYALSRNNGRDLHIITSKVEHHAVLDTCEFLGGKFKVTFLDVDKYGMVKPEDVKKAITKSTVMISVMYANNEVGTINPISEIGSVAKEEKKKREKSGIDMPIYFHTDAVQAIGTENCNVDLLGVDLLSCSAHKIYGPKGVGFLYAKSGTPITPLNHGGQQERKMRSGTENVAYIAGLAAAMEASEKVKVKSKKEISELTNYLIERITKEISEVELIGHPKKRLPGNACFLFKRVEGESILINLDMNGIAASSGSACTSGSLEPSHVTKAMGYSDLEAHGAVRFSLGRLNKKEDVDKLMKILPGIVDKLRAMSPIKG